MKKDVKILLGLFGYIAYMNIIFYFYGTILSAFFALIGILVYLFWLTCPNKYFYVESNKLRKTKQLGDKNE